MTEIASGLGKSTRIARLAICEDDTCTFPTTPHLVIGIDEVPLHREYAVAISYVWGQFYRQRRPIGHGLCDRKEVSMELGREWVIQDFVERLAELSKTKAIWIDQLCLPQREEQVAKALADIPSIYRTLDVVIFMPGNPCGCIPEILYEISKIPNDPRYDTKVEECIRRRKECLGWGVASWVRRLWPRQELMFSQRVRCVWASKEKRKCATQDGFRSPQDVPVLNKIIIDMELRDSPPNKDVTLAYTQRALRHYMNQAEQVILSDYTHYVFGSQEKFRTHQRLSESFFRFLLGEEICNGGPIERLPEKFLFIMRLQLEMGALRDYRRTRRAATRPRDYVIAIWTACPGYEVPDDYRSMSLSKLLQDAVDQLQKRHEMALATTAPRGLFGFPCMGSALWNPAEYLSAVVPASDVDVYRTLADEGWAFDVYHKTMVPICIRNTEQPALSMQAFDYHALIEMCEVELENNGSYSEVSYGTDVTPRLVEILHGAMKNWKTGRRQALQCAFKFDDFQQFIAQPLTFGTTQKENDTISQRRLRRPVRRYLEFFLDHGFNENILDAYRQHLEPYVNPFHLGEIYDAIYIIVAASLELDVEYCEKNGAKLMFHLGDCNKVKPRVGFSTKGIKIGAKGDKGDCITVSMVGHQWVVGSLLYEAISIPPAPRAENLLPYLVFGVWVPTESVTSNEYGAQVKPPERRTKDEKQGVLI